MRKLLILLPLLVGALTGVAQAQDADSVDLPMIKSCLAATETAELQGCVRKLAEYIKIVDDMDQASRVLVARCADQAPETFKQCAKTYLTFDPKRTERADALAGALRTWEVSTNKSKMNDSTSVFLSLEADDEVTTVGAPFRPRLLLRCMENVTSVLVFGEWFLGDGVPVVYRIDKEQPVAQTWQRSDNYKTAGLWDGGRAIPMIKTLLGKSTLVMRITPRSEGPKEMSFNISGLDKVIEPLKKSCKW